MQAKRQAFETISNQWYDKYQSDEQLHYARGYLKCLEAEVLSIETVVKNNFKMAMEEAQTGIADVPPEDA